MQVAYQILKQLACGHFYSGEVLAKMHHVSRARIWQAIETLRGWGLDIYSVPGRGYRLSHSLELLDQKLIQSMLYGDAISDIKHIDIFDSIDSTNDHILKCLDRSPNYSGYAVISESQKRGRGRHQRLWYSPFAKNIALSLYWRLSINHTQISGLSLIIGVAVIKAIHAMLGQHQDLGLKWPNDIWYKNKKVAGILIETRGAARKDKALDLIIGVGCNTSKIQNSDLIDLATSLEDIYQTKISRNELISHILSQIIVSLKYFDLYGLGPFVKEWQSFDLLSNRMIELQLPDQTSISGLCLGIDPMGALSVKVNDIQKTYLSGEIRVRPYATIC